MTDQTADGARNQATFQARVAGVGLITTLVVLVAACLSFMFQHWTVACTQTRHAHEVLAEITATAADAALAAGDRRGAVAAVSGLAQSPAVVSARLVMADGSEVARYARPREEGRTGDLQMIQRPIGMRTGRMGQLELAVEPPSLSAMLPEFLALSAALFFGGLGVALFLARGLAQRVIAPVLGLSEAMRKVAGGDFRRVELKADDALFQSLTDSFNHLLSELDGRDRDLRLTMEDLVQARDAANAANVLKSQFLANMSHEIRTPLNGVLAMAEVMHMGDLAPNQRERLDIIRQSGGVLLAVLNDVLDLSKIEAGKLSLEVQDFDLARTVAPSTESFGLMARNKNLDFALTVTPAAAGAWRGDADRLRQILNNLLANAVKFTTEGQVAATFDVAETGDLRLTVADTGIGISADKLPSLFEKFTQADNSATRRFGGTGLGLAICRELTQMMGGEIDVATVEGEGSTFTVILPLERGVAPAEPVSVAEETMSEAEEGALRVLAAEDNPTNQQVLAAVMGSLGISVDIVDDGQAAVTAWAAGEYDLILMDIQMPVMDGLDAARTIRETERATQRARTPIIALTANALNHQVQDYLAAGMDDHVAKPIEIAKLYDAMGRVLTAAANATAAA